MHNVISKVKIVYEQDVVFARQRSRLIAELLGFGPNDQTRISTAVSELVRNTFQYARGGEVEFAVSRYEQGQVFTIVVRDQGPGIADVDAILQNRYISRSGMGQGIPGARRLMDFFQLESEPASGTTICMGKRLTSDAVEVTPALLTQLELELSKNSPHSPLEEIRRQNQELLIALEQLREKEQQLIQLNRELNDTNQGVLALYGELDEKARYLDSANQLKTRLLSSMSHEVRTPINSILSLSRLLLDGVDGELGPEQHKQVSLIRHCASELSRLVNDMLDLARLEAGKLEVNPRRCTAEEIFSGLRGMLRPLLRDGGPVLTFEEPRGIPHLYTDDGKISQILRNFLSNALKFTMEGEIRVGAQLDEDANAVVFSVSDTGIGIAPADQERIFEEYNQLESGAKLRAKGAGLGLSISRRLAEMLGGSVGVESTPGAGSTFYTRIPLQIKLDTLTAS